MYYHTLCIGGRDLVGKAANLVRAGAFSASNVEVKATPYHDFELIFQTSKIIGVLTQMDLRDDTLCFAAEFNEELEVERSWDEDWDALYA